MKNTIKILSLIIWITALWMPSSSYGASNERINQMRDAAGLANGDAVLGDIKKVGKRTVKLVTITGAVIALISFIIGAVMIATGFYKSVGIGICVFVMIGAFLMAFASNFIGYILV